MLRRADPTAAPPPQLRPFPAWARPKPQPCEDVDAAFLAGAGLAALDAVVRADPPFGGLWRQRLALTAAAASVKMLGRTEDDSLLRDAWLLRRLDADPGPAGRVYFAWRQLAQRVPDLSAEAISRAAQAFGLATDTADILAAAEDATRNERPAVFAAADLAAHVVALRPDAEILGLWLADLVLAQKLRWPVALPLLAGQIAHPSLRASGGWRRPRPADENWQRAVCLGYALAAAAAVDLSSDLARRAEKLQAVAPRLRAKGAGAVIAALLDDDAVTASLGTGKMSDRGLRRLFDRLVALAAVRELSGRTTFRIYGL